MNVHVSSPSIAVAKPAKPDAVKAAKPNTVNDVALQQNAAISNFMDAADLKAIAAELARLSEPQHPTKLNALIEEALADLPADEAVLIPLYEAYRATDEALQGVFNQPRCRGGAADLIEDEQERAREHAEAIVLKLSQLTSIKDFWAESYLETMLSHCFYIGGGAAEALEVVAKCAALPVATTSDRYQAEHQLILDEA